MSTMSTGSPMIQEDSTELNHTPIERNLRRIVLPPIGQLRRRRSGKIPSPSHSDGKVPQVEGDNEPNPFRIPKDIHQFLLQLERDKEERRKEDRATPTMLKQTNTYKTTQMVRNRIKPFCTPAYKPGQEDAFKAVTWKAQTGLHINHLQKVSRKIHSEYISHRKTVFYLKRTIRTRQLALKSLSTKREDDAATLRNYEWLTTFTQDTFDTFLKDNDDDTMAALRTSEAALKDKLEKALEVRNLNIRINQLKSEILGANESLRECKSYMKFLDDIAREVMRKDEEEENRAFRREQQIKEEIVTFMKKGLSLKEAQAAVAQNERKFDDKRVGLKGLKTTTDGRTSSMELVHNLNKELQKSIEVESDYNFVGDDVEDKNVSSIKAEVAERKSSMKTKGDRKQPLSTIRNNGRSSNRSHASKPRQVSIIERLPGEDEDGYNEKALLESLQLVTGNAVSDMQELANLSFTRPSQLLQIYSDMEEANLSLIQHSQASEEVLDQVNQQIQKTRRALNDRGRKLRKEINNMQQNIENNEERASALTKLVDMFTGGNYDVRQQQKLFRLLRRNVAKVYRSAIGNIDHHLNPILMLTSIEKNFEDLMQEIQAMPDDIVLQISRELDKERREVERNEKLSKRKQQQEERNIKNLARARAPIRIKKGRPLYPRSKPPKEKIHLSQAELEKKAEQDEFNYYFGE